ncbi:hypothetical protein N337_04261, partial [Phoenicopterus ruber ruber]
DRETTKPYPHSSVEGEGGEEAKKSIVKEDKGKKKKKRTAEDKRHPRERMLDSDDLLFVPRREVKQSARNSLPSDEEEFAASSFSISSSWRSSRRQTLQSPSASTPSSPKHPCCLHSPAVKESSEPGKS